MRKTDRGSRTPPHWIEIKGGPGDIERPLHRLGTRVRDTARRMNHRADQADLDDLASGQVGQVPRSDTYAAAVVAGDEPAPLCPTGTHEITGVQQQRG